MSFIYKLVKKMLILFFFNAWHSYWRMSGKVRWGNTALATNPASQTHKD